MTVLTRWEPFREIQQEMKRMQQDMGRLFERWVGNERNWPGLGVLYPPINLREDDDFVYAEAELPGQKLSDLEISVAAENQLTLKGKREPAAPENLEWHRQERGFGRFERTIALPVAVDTANIDARLENGVLAIKMAKTPAAKPRKIVVKAE
ncbi:MAG: Hsp20/alpha crystallin family protein [Planctomycetia bacterium]|nr:Hsp20/alpha crystallin family protein [Planctomycetia bacterium]